MRNKSGSSLPSLLCCLLLFALAAPASGTAGECPTAADEIVTDRPDVTNSSVVVPFSSLQAENGVDWVVQHGSNSLDATNTRLRVGVAHCTEFLIDVPSYLGSLNGSESSGFSDAVVSFKRQLPVPFGFDLSATGGLGFPTGNSKISGPGYQPYIQFPWSREIAQGWDVDGMFTLTWHPSSSQRNPTFEPTLSLAKDFGNTAELFVEYAGDYDHERPAQLLDGGGAWRFSKTQQLDFHVGLGLNSSTVDHYFGIGYSFRLDGLFRAAAGHSP
jgi:Putative MetA-pathway of phenol degradation